MGDAQKKLQELSESYQGLQAGKKPSHSQHEKIFANVGTELGTAVEARQKLESQQQENDTVKKVGKPNFFQCDLVLRDGVIGIRPPRRRCEHLQANRASVVEAG
jgi:hypothetical protein